jgi:hypothetical protein
LRFYEASCYPEFMNQDCKTVSARLLLLCSAEHLLAHKHRNVSLQRQ